MPNITKFYIACGLKTSVVFYKLLFAVCLLSAWFVECEFTADWDENFRPAGGEVFQSEQVQIYSQSEWDFLAGGVEVFRPEKMRFYRRRGWVFSAEVKNYLCVTGGVTGADFSEGKKLSLRDRGWFFRGKNYLCVTGGDFSDVTGGRGYFLFIHFGMTFTHFYPNCTHYQLVNWYIFPYGKIPHRSSI